MLNKKRKGFTIVELVIVIAVIAVLAAVLIPTFSSVVDRAHESAALQEVQNAYINALADALGTELKDTTVEADGFKFTFSDETGQNATIEGPDGFNYSAKVENGVVVLGPASGGTGEDTEDEEDGGVTTVDGFKTALAAALETDGTVTLGGPIVITEHISIPSEKAVTIDLNGHTLELNDPSNETNGASHAIDVQGTLNIVDDPTNPGTIILNKENEYCVWQCGINVGGTLNLNGVNVTCNRRCNIENYGTTNLTNSKFTVKNGTGLYSANGDTVISGGEFVASGSSVTPILSEDGYSGTMEISGTRFTEENSATYSQAVIVWGSTEGLVLTDVTMTTTQANVAAYSSCVTIKGGSFGGSLNGKPLVIQANDGGEYGTFAGEITLGGTGNSISGGKFNGKLIFGYTTEIIIESGIFSGGLYCSGSNGDYAEVTINGGTFSNTLEFIDWSDVKINGGTFNSVLTLKRSSEAVINIYIKYGTTFGETTLSATTGDSAVYTVPSGSSANSVTKGTDGWTITKP